MGDRAEPVFVLECHEVVGLRFVAVRPVVFFPWYDPQFGPEVFQAVDAGGPDDVLVLVILTLHSTAEKSTANLLGPLVVNGATGQAVQAVLSGSGSLPPSPIIGLLRRGSVDRLAAPAPATRLPAHRPGKEREVLVLTRHVHQSIVIGHDVVVTVLEVRGDQVRLGITAPKEIQVHREEVFAALTAANRQAATSATSASELEALKALKGQAPLAAPATTATTGVTGAVDEATSQPQPP